MGSFSIGEKIISVYPAEAENCPVIYLNTFGRESDDVMKAMRALHAADCTLVAISGLDWNHDMAPWDIPPVSPNDTPCTGGADDYLKLLTKVILPKAEQGLNGKPCWRAVAGYSLAGLFAVYSLYRTDVFSRVASISGSLWFPGIIEYVMSHEQMRMPECMYFSLGDREHKTRNQYLRTVRKNTENIESYYAGKGIATVFRLNPGNHFVNAAERTAAGIAWILER